MDLQVAAAVGTFLSALAGAGGILAALHIYKRKVNAELFLQYTSRYQEVMDSFPSEAREARLDVESAPPEPSEDLSLAVLRYLNLCSEEYYLCKQGYLSEDVWAIWERELQRTLASPLLRREWEELRSEFSAYPEFVSYVDSVQTGEPGSIPSASSSIGEASDGLDVREMERSDRPRSTTESEDEDVAEPTDGEKGMRFLPPLEEMRRESERDHEGVTYISPMYGASARRRREVRDSEDEEGTDDDQE